MQKKFNVIKRRESNSSLIYFTRQSDNLAKDEVKLGEIYANNLYEASKHLEEGLDLNARGIYSTSGKIEILDMFPDIK
jgi:hypothetical protein